MYARHPSPSIGRMAFRQPTTAQMSHQAKDGAAS
jgi:hypothetical protein